MKLRKKVFTAVSSLAIAASVLLTGCATPAPETGGAPLAESGALTLSVNPEIEIEYNKEGQVTALIGKNDDGKQIVASYQDYIGKECGVVLEELIGDIYEAGYFVDDIDGNKKNIVLQLEPGSVLPSGDFLANMTASAQNAVKGMNLSSGVVAIDGDDYDPKYAKDGKPSPYITLEKAKEIALTQAHVNAADAVFKDKEFDHDDGTAIFELEFIANGNEYEYDIDAVTGKVLKAEHDIAGAQIGGSPNSSTVHYDDTDYGPNNDGVTDYNDTDYGPNNDGVTDYNDTDYGPNNDGVTDYNDTDYGPNNDGVTDYNDTDYGPNNDGVTDYGNTNYYDDYGDHGDTNYYDDDGDHGDTNYGDTNYYDDDGDHGETNYNG